MEQKKLPRGLRNKNPLNLRRTGQLWQGLAERQTDPAFYQFLSLPWGYRAAFVVLRTYVWRRNCKTLVSIIKRWAPDADGNDSEFYLRRVCALTGFNRDTVVDPLNAEQMIPIVMAMSRVENGLPANMGDVVAGWVLYMG